MKMFKLAGLLAIGAMSSINAADNAVDTDWDFLVELDAQKPKKVLPTTQVVQSSQPHVADQPGAAPIETDAKRSAAQIQLQQPAAVPSEADVKKAAAASTETREICVRILYHAAGNGNDKQACLLDGLVKVPKDGAITLANIRKLASALQLRHTGGVYCNECLMHVSALLKVNPNNFRCSVGFHEREKGDDGDLLSKFKNPDTVHLSNIPSGN